MLSRTCFNQLDNEDRCRAMQLLGYISCASAGTLRLKYDRDGKIGDASCVVCDNTLFSTAESSDCDEGVAHEALATFLNIIDLPEFEESRRPRVMGMIALRSFALHFKLLELLTLETSKLGQWCLRSLRSSMRELRITAG
jgi:serine/threonine-protein kinase ATR